MFREQGKRERERKMEGRLRRRKVKPFVTPKIFLIFT